MAINAAVVVVVSLVTSRPQRAAIALAMQEEPGAPDVAGSSRATGFRWSGPRTRRLRIKHFQPQGGKLCRVAATQSWYHPGWRHQFDSCRARQLSQLLQGRVRSPTWGRAKPSCGTRLVPAARCTLAATLALGTLAARHRYRDEKGYRDSSIVDHAAWRAASGATRKTAQGRGCVKTSIRRLY